MNEQLATSCRPCRAQHIELYIICHMGILPSKTHDINTIKAAFFKKTALILNNKKTSQPIDLSKLPRHTTHM